MNPPAATSTAMRSTFALGAIAVLMFTAFTQQASAAAKASDVDPARDRIGQIVYPLGVHPPKDSGLTKGITAHDKVSTKAPAAKSKTTGVE